jgi:plastocyanin
VVAQEFRFALSRQTIKAGLAIIELRNSGQDAHDLRLHRVGGTRIYALPLTQSGQTVDREFKLLPGTYRLYCSVANHRALGTQATLVVQRR